MHPKDVSNAMDLRCIFHCVSPAGSSCLMHGLGLSLSMIVYKAKKQLIRINKASIDIPGGSFVGPFNFLHESNLNYLIEPEQAEMFGRLLHPAIFAKQTRLAASSLFLYLNSFTLDDCISYEKLAQFILSVASGEISLDEGRTRFAPSTSPFTTHRKAPDEKY